MRVLLLALTAAWSIAAQESPLSPLSGISLPAGARLDKGFMIRMAGRITLTDALKMRQASLGTYEMYRLRPGTVWSEFASHLTAQGWTLTELPDPEFKLAWASKGPTRLFALFIPSAKDPWAYLAEAGQAAPSPTPDPRTTADSAAQPALPRAPTTVPPPAGTADRRLVGVWLRSASFDMRSAVGSGYITHQYIFQSDGTYAYSRRHFPGTGYRLWVWRETGRWAVDRDQLTIVPERSALDEFEKKGGVDSKGPRVSRTTQALERTTYRIRTHYFEGLKEWNLVLETNAPTRRDGSFTTNPSFPNSWLFSPAGPSRAAIDSGFTGW